MIALLKNAGAKRSADIKGKVIGKAHDQWKNRTYTNTQPQDQSGIEYKLSLTFDIPFREPGVNFPFDQFVYTIKQLPGRLLQPYQISLLLDTATNMIHVRRAEARAKMLEYPLSRDRFLEKDVLYHIYRVTKDYQELFIETYSDSPKFEIIRLQRDCTGKLEGLPWSRQDGYFTALPHQP
ncbi:uncharacterized protein BJX67DRAFT_378748 [Aspergillus lucknowensis]|uniref:Uncharacterized protein n=1 Tax=Aspergillus lucknowensis TaxID=176173 RepID=A0ABR4LYT9_9EURO